MMTMGKRNFMAISSLARGTQVRKKGGQKTQRSQKRQSRREVYGNQQAAPGAGRLLSQNVAQA
jgi:hypothetical protein